MKYFARFAHFLFVCISLAASAESMAESPLFQIRAVADPGSSVFETCTLKQGDAVETVRVNPTVWLDERDIESVKVQTGADGMPAIVIVLTEASTKRWGVLTSSFTGKRIAIFLLGKLVSAPRIGQPLRGSRIEVSGGFSEEEAKEFLEKFGERAAR
jgi:preprotein translocase subunit SecD